MKPFSLRFIKEGLDTKYQQHKVQINKGAFWRSLLIYLSMAFTFGLYSFFLGQWMIGIIFAFYSICVVPLIYITLQKYSRLFDQLCFVFQSAIFFTLPLFAFLKLHYGPLRDVDTFITGQASIFIVISFNLGSRFDLKCLAILVNFVGQISIVIQKQKITPITLIWVVTNLMILNYIYQHDRVEKEAFLIKQNEKLWQKEIGSCSKISIISLESNEGRLELSIKNCNLISQQEFCITDQDSLNLFLKNAKLIPKNKFNQQILNDMKSLSKSKKYISLYNQIHKYSEKTRGINQEFVGLLGKSIYDIKIFTTWSDQLLYIHVLMTKSLTQTESEISKKHNYERDLFTQYRKQISIQLKTILFKQKKYISKQYQTAHESIISEIHNALRMSYNIQLFLNPLYQQTKISFFLLPFIDQINVIIKDGMPQPLKLTIKSLIDPGTRIYSCQKTIFHIIFNLLSIIVRPAQKSGYVILSAKERADRQGTFIYFCIASNLQTNANLAINQSCQRRLYGEDRGFDFDNKNVGLEIIVSEYLIGKLGPRRKIKFEYSSEDRLMMMFSIYQDLDQTI